MQIIKWSSVLAAAAAFAVPTTGAVGATMKPGAPKKPAAASKPRAASVQPWPVEVQAALNRAGKNRPQILDALTRVPAAHRDALVFLVENMPESDLQTLSADFLLDNVDRAYQALDRAPWKASLSRDLFFNDVLPYASLTEKRESWRGWLGEKAAALVAGATTPTEAAQKLNAGLFPLLKVRYSTDRARPDQAPGESAASGIASCSGLSILLVDACRSVAVPARIVGTPLWANGRGNHTWVEIWDQGWHFTGAAEPDPKGLDRAWFTADAAQATANDPVHAIYATSFKKTGVTFPLVWSPGTTDIYAENVTLRYAAADNGPNPADVTRMPFQVLDENGKPVAAQVVVQDPDTGQIVFRGTTKDATADLNDRLTFNAAHNHTYRVTIGVAGKILSGDIRTGTEPERSIDLDLRRLAAAQPAAQTPPPPPFYTPAPEAPIRPLPAAQETALETVMAAYFDAVPEKRTTWAFPAMLEDLLVTNEPAVRQAAWKAFVDAPIHGALKDDFDKRQVTFEQYLSPYTLKDVGKRPKNGWPLVIAMHGGGGAPKAVNDEQWGEMQVYYKDHPEIGGYKYLALRAPNDTWNGFYDVYVYPLIHNLVEQQILFNDVDPKKVFLIGYSHGGYGALAIGPKEPDLFAAVHASAAAPTDGETSAKTLRNTPFSVWVGELDTMYGRLDRDKKFADQIKALKGDRKDIYPVTVEIKAGRQHSDLPDRDFLPLMYNETRNPVPRELTWEQTDNVITDFFWLHTDKPGKNQEIDATCRDNHVTVTTTPNVSSASVLLDGRLVDLEKPLTLEVNGNTSTVILHPSLKTLCDTLLTRGDPYRAFTISIPLQLPDRGAAP